MNDRLPPGKVPWDIVADLVSGALPPEVKLGPAAGEDAALVEIGDEPWAIASDPISFTAVDAGRLAVIVNANDVAVRGAEPLLFCAVVLVAPAEARMDEVQRLLGELRAHWRRYRPRQWLFPGQRPTVHLCDTSIQKAYGAAKAAAGIAKQGGIHSLRHAYATHQLGAGMPVTELQRQLGHSHVSSTLRYLHWLPEYHERGAGTDLLAELARTGTGGVFHAFSRGAELALRFVERATAPEGER